MPTAHDEVGSLEFGDADETPLRGHAIEIGEPDVAAASSTVITAFAPLALAAPAQASPAGASPRPGRTRTNSSTKRS